MKKFVATTQLAHYILILAVFFSLGFSVSAQKITDQKHMLWKVSSEDGVKGYLAGSIHLVKPDFYPLDSVFHRVFAKSETVVFELDMKKAKSGLLSAMDLAVYKNGGQLQDHLPPELYAKTEKHLKKIGLPNVESFKPWFAAFMIKAQNAMEEGSTTPGLDTYFYKKAQKKNKNIVPLETAEEQMKIFADLDEDGQVDFLKYTLENTGKDKKQSDSLVQYWKTGNVNAVHDLINNKSFSHLGNFSKKLNQRLIIDRNKSWRKKIKTMFEHNKKPMIIVGLGHLVGNHNLIDRLKKDGYTIEQM